MPRFLKWRFVRVNNKIIIMDGKSPLRYFDLKTFRFYTYKGKKFRFRIRH